MPRLESLFSVQVTQPYLNEPFPIRLMEPHNDRLFKHITFLEDNTDQTYRLRVINHNYITASSVLQKRVSTEIYVPDIHQERFRVKAVLSEPEHGIEESHWVTQKNMESEQALAFNQYRMRGVSDKNWKSDWVYSELRNYDNELIVYNMLYDMIDLLSTVHDGEIDYLMDYIVSDTFIKVIREHLPHYATTIDLEEFKMTTIQELLSILSSRVDNNPQEQFVTKLGESFLALSNEMKKEFKENIMTTPEEFSTLYRSYKLFDQYRGGKQDVMSLLLEIFLEDRLEKLVQKTDIEVLLQNDEEMGIYLNGVYEFNIKNELITAIYDASPNDSFVTNLHDAVSLLSEPIVFESLAYQQNEEVSRFLRLALMEVYAPLVATDVRLLELEHSLEDTHQLDITGGIVEYDILDGEAEARYLMIADIVGTLFKGDLELREEYEVLFLDKMLNSMLDSRKALLIDYNFGEYVEILLNLGESFRHAYNKEFGTVQEKKTTTLIDKFQYNHQTSVSSLVDRYHAILQDTAHLSRLKTFNNLNELSHVSLIDHILHKYDLFRKSINENIRASLTSKATHQHNVHSASPKEDIHSSMIDQTLLANLYQYLRTQENTSAGLEDFVSHLDTIFRLDWQEGTQTALQDALQHIDTTSYTVWDEEKATIPEDWYYNLFKHYLRDPNKFPILERQDIDLSHDLRDLFLLDGTELVQYALGNMDDGWPIGVFRLGVNTLKGEVSN